MTQKTSAKIGLGTIACAVAIGWGTLHSQTNESTSPQVAPQTQAADKGQLLDFQMKSKDRMITGAIKILDSWKGTSLRIVNTTTGQDMGTYGNMLENLTATKPTFKIYNSKSDIFSEKDMQDAKTDPAVTQQKVVFYKDDNDPKLLHFATTFDDVGTVQVQVIQGGKQVAYGEAKLTVDAEFSALINTVDKDISGAPSPIIDPMDPNDANDPSNRLGVLVAEQPGPLSNPGDIDAHKTDPKALVLPVHAGNEAPSPSDADLVLVTLRRPFELKGNTGTITLGVSAPASVTIFSADGKKVLTDYSVDLAKPSGDLAALARSNAQVWVRGAAVSNNVVLTCTYTDADGKVKATDQVNLSVTKP